MSIFYCLFFCIYFNNPFIIDFLRTLVHKMIKSQHNRSNQKIDLILEYIDIHGLERLRTAGENLNTFVYHLVFYEAVNDELRVIYSKII